MVEAAVAIGIVMVVTWLVSVVVHDASIVDPVWGLGFVIVAWVVAVSGSPGPTGWVIVGMVTLWGLRLSVYLAWRNLGKGEDYRYQAMRRKQGRWFPLKSLLTVFGLQGVLMWIVSLPVQNGVEGPAFGVVGVIGIVAWATGLLFEMIGDAQLTRFKADPANAGAVMDQGLWRYTRHPNYFGDFLVWWGIYLVALGGAWSAWWTAIGPLVMTVLLMRVSGVGLLEKTITSRRPGYVEYQRRTNAFFPGPPRE